MRRRFALAVSAALISTYAVAQQQPAPGANTPAVTTPNTPPNPNAPVPGANSFTEGQAKSRIEARGYTVTDLTKDAEGIWRGKGTKAGKIVSVSVDFQGNVTER